MDLAFVRRQTGEYLPLASPQEAAAYAYTAQEREKIRANRSRLFVGTRQTLRERLAPLVAATGADEVMVATAIYDHEARKHSYALLAEAFGLAGALARAAS